MYFIITWKILFTTAARALKFHIVKINYTHKKFPKMCHCLLLANISMPATQCGLAAGAGDQHGVSMAEGIPVLPTATGRGSQAICKGHHSQGQTPAHGDCATFCGEVGTCSLPRNELFAMQAQCPYRGLHLEGMELRQPCLCWMLSVG